MAIKYAPLPGSIAPSPVKRPIPKAKVTYRVTLLDRCSKKPITLYASRKSGSFVVTEVSKILNREDWTPEQVERMNQTLVGSEVKVRGNATLYVS